MMQSTTIDCLRSACRDDGGGGVAAGPSDAGAAHADVGQSDDCAIRASGCAPTGAVRCCYEAGPCGFELQRALTATGSRAT